MEIIRFNIIVLQEGPAYVAWAPAFDLSSCGDSVKEAKNNLAEAVSLFWEECKKKGTLKKVLTSLGWQSIVKHHHKKLLPPKVVSQKQSTIALSLA